MNKKYTRISNVDCFLIYSLLQLKKPLSEIAFATNKHISSIRRFVKNYPDVYVNPHKAASLLALNALNKSFGKTKIQRYDKLASIVHEKLTKKWSPEQISNHLKKYFTNDKSMQLSKESIYLYIHVHCKPELRKLYQDCLRQKRKFRGNVRRGADKRTTIKDPIRIDERPQEVQGRLIPGHWEGDLVMGKDRASAIGTLNERTTRTVIIVPLKKRDAESVRKAFENAFKNIPKEMKKTLTYDNGTEMAQHKQFTKNTKIKVYFAHPYSPWERPTNENSNGLIRDFFPKGTDFNNVTKKQLKEVQDLLNERPRKVLNWCTPKDVFDEYVTNKIG